MKRFLLLSILLFPLVSFAAGQAGFPSQAIWASKFSALEGETIVISTVVYNSSSESVRATIVFTAEEVRIGAREFELPSGESQIHSIEWKPKKGEYEVAAKIEGTPAELAQRETPSIHIMVAGAPPPKAVEQAISQVVETATTLASSSAPVVMQAAQTLFAHTEAIREAGIERLENYLAANATRASVVSSNVQGFIAGTSTESKPGVVKPEGRNANVLSAIAQTAAASVLFAFKSIALFYPLLILVVLGVLYFLARRVRRMRD